MTYTVATLPVSALAYEEIEAKLKAADYGHDFVDGALDMRGIGLTKAARRVDEDRIERDVLRALRALEDPQGWATPDGGALLDAAGIATLLRELAAERRALHQERQRDANKFAIEYMEYNERGEVTVTRRALREYPEWAPAWARWSAKTDSTPTAAAAPMTFESAWETWGYDYGADALENVKVGWDLAKQAYGIRD